MGKAQFRITADGACAIGSILFKGMLVEFLIDAADVSGVQQHHWHYASNAYIATSVRVQELDASGTPIQKKKELYLHTFLMQPPEGQVVQHISKNGLDNRRKNLRMVDASAPGATAAGTVKKQRKTELPGPSGIKPEDIPTHIWYVHANGYHRDRFAIEFKTEGILWKSTSSKKVSLQEKLEQAKVKLEELYELYPYLDPKKEEDKVKALQASFQEIMAAAPVAPAATTV